jgi:hypothetical protein
MFCYSRPVGHVILEQRKKLRQGLVSYFKSNDINVLKKHMDADHRIIVKNFEKEINNSLKNPLEKQLAKKRPTMSANAISNFLGAIDPFKKDNVH